METKKEKLLLPIQIYWCFCQRPNGGLVMDEVDREDKEIGTNDEE